MPHEKVKLQFNHVYRYEIRINIFGDMQFLVVLKVTLMAIYDPNLIKIVRGVCFIKTKTVIW